jgi:hypothetical protein
LGLPPTPQKSTPSPNPNRKNEKKRFNRQRSRSAERIVIILCQLVRLIKPDFTCPPQTGSKGNLHETRKLSENPPKTRPNNTPQDPLGSQEGKKKAYPKRFWIKRQNYVVYAT